MRRTEQEFKEEVLIRSRVYQQKRAKQRKVLLSISMCICLCFAGLKVFDPFGAKSEAPAADMMLMQNSKTESAMAQQSAGGTERNMTADAAPAEKAPEPMAPESEEGAVAGTSRSYNVICIKVQSVPQHEEYDLFFDSLDKIVPIIVALERFYPVDDTLTAQEPGEGLGYEITVTYTNETVSYTLFGDALYSDVDGLIRIDASSARKLEKALLQESDEKPDVSVSMASAANTWPLDEADALAIHAFLGQSGWAHGMSRCIMDCKIIVNGKIYQYSSHCGTFYDAQMQQSLTLEESDRVAINELLRAYIPLEADETAAVKVIYGSEEMTLDAADAAVILEYFQSGDWIMAASNCLCDYTLEVGSEIYFYHSDCGTVQDGLGRSLRLQESEKMIFNNIVARCPVGAD